MTGEQRELVSSLESLITEATETATRLIAHEDLAGAEGFVECAREVLKARTEVRLVEAPLWVIRLKRLIELYDEKRQELLYSKAAEEVFSV